MVGSTRAQSNFLHLMFYSKEKEGDRKEKKTKSYNLESKLVKSLVAAVPSFAWHVFHLS